MAQLNSAVYKERRTDIDMGNELVVKWNRGWQGWEGVSNQNALYRCPKLSKNKFNN